MLFTLISKEDFDRISLTQLLRRMTKLVQYKPCDEKQEAYHVRLDLMGGGYNEELVQERLWWVSLINHFQKAADREMKVNINRKQSYFDNENEGIKALNSGEGDSYYELVGPFSEEQGWEPVGQQLPSFLSIGCAYCGW